MVRGDRAAVATFYAPDLVGVGEVALGAPVAHHATVRRLTAGASIRVTNGSGLVGAATITSVRKGDLLLEVTTVESIPPLPALQLLVPVADRDRMLWLAEKGTELGISLWQPVLFSRSRSVSPRGEGGAFAAKVRSRMIAALEQSGGAWLPEVRQELPLDLAARLDAVPWRFVLDRDGPPLHAAGADDGAAVIFGPEGGIEPEEHMLLREHGWRRAALAPTTLRFETAGVAAVAILRAGVTSTFAGE